MELTYRFLQESKNPDRLQEVIQVVVEIRGLFCRVDIWMQLFRIRFDQRLLLQRRVLVQVPEAYPVVQCHCREYEYEHERVEIELRANFSKLGSVKCTRSSRAYSESERIRQNSVYEPGH